MLLGHVLALLLALGVSGGDTKIESAFYACQDRADEFSYDDCGVEMNVNEIDVWFHYYCESYDIVHDVVNLDEVAIEHYQWAGRRLERRDGPVLLGCPVAL